jgi:hypothetical protein
MCHCFHLAISLIYMHHNFLYENTLQRYENGFFIVRIHHISHFPTLKCCQTPRDVCRKNITTSITLMLQ